MPLPGCWVSLNQNSSIEKLGIVIQQIVDGDRSTLKVHWFSTKDVTTVNADEVNSGFKLGMDVMLSIDDSFEFGEGIILQTRAVAGVAHHGPALVPAPLRLGCRRRHCCVTADAGQEIQCR